MSFSYKIQLASLNRLFEAKECNDENLQQELLNHRDDIIDSFGGFANMVKLCLTNGSNSHYLNEDKIQIFQNILSRLSKNDDDIDSYQVNETKRELQHNDIELTSSNLFNTNINSQQNPTISVVVAKDNNISQYDMSRPAHSIILNINVTDCWFFKVLNYYYNYNIIIINCNYKQEQIIYLIMIIVIIII